MATKTIKANELKRGMTLVLPGGPVQVTHVRKSRTFKGFYAVQYNGTFEGRPMVRAADFRWSDTVTVEE